MKLEGQVRIPSGCAISAVISREGRRMTGEDIIRSMVPMHDRSNGLGGGFAAYGIYPEHREEYAFHIFFDDNTTRRECEAMLKEGFELVDAELIPIRIIPEITDILQRKEHGDLQGGRISRGCGTLLPAGGI